MNLIPSHKYTYSFIIWSQSAGKYLVKMTSKACSRST